MRVRATKVYSYDIHTRVNNAVLAVVLFCGVSAFFHKIK